MVLRGIVASCVLSLLSHAVTAANSGAPAHPPNNTEWSGWGANIYNNRWASTNTQINSSSIGGLVQNCKLDYPQGVSATPVVLDDTAYYPTSNGSFYALNIGTCDYVWQINVTKICWDFLAPSALVLKNSLPMSRTSPQIDGNVLYFATQAHALLVAVDLSTGKLLGTTKVNDHPLAILTMSPTVYEGKIFIGASSQEESATLDPTYPCCDFIGNFAAYTFNTKTNKFTQVWSVSTLPAGKGWSGASVWGSQPSIDPTRNQVFIGIGNTYVYPTEFVKCLNASASCLPDDVWQESVVALDIPTGKVNWRKSISSLDGWVMVCGYAGAPVSLSPLCPERPGIDADFGMAPTFVPAALGAGTTGIDSVVVGQKDGYIYSFDAVTGDITWHILTSPDADSGGLSWGMAVDDSQIYFTAINFGSRNLTLQPTGGFINNSAFGAASLKTGAFNWETPCPDNQLAYTPPGLVNDLVFVSQSGSGTVTIPGAVLALSKTSGAILHSWPVDSVARGGITVSGGFMMFGTGYHYENPFKNGSFYVYGLPGAITAVKTKPKPPSITTTGKAQPTATTTLGAGATGTSGEKKSVATRTSKDLVWTVIYPVAFLAFMMVWFG
jgi:outer membrane protein assembly factor BamB